MGHILAPKWPNHNFCLKKKLASDLRISKGVDISLSINFREFQRGGESFPQNFREFRRVDPSLPISGNFKVKTLLPQFQLIRKVSP